MSQPSYSEHQKHAVDVGPHVEDGLAMATPNLSYFVFGSDLCAFDCGRKHAVISVSVPLTMIELNTPVTVVKAVLTSPSATRLLIHAVRSGYRDKPDGLLPALHPPGAHGMWLCVV